MNLSLVNLLLSTVLLIGPKCMLVCLGSLKPDADTILNDHVKQNYDCEGNVVRMSPLIDRGSRGYPT